MKKAFLLLALVSLGFLTFAQSAYSQTTNSQFSLGIYPPILEISANPPSLIEADIQIQNFSGLPQNLGIIFKSFRQDSADGTLRYINEDAIEGPDSLILDRIKVYDGNPISELNLEPFESKDLKLKINLDKDSPRGDYYFSVIFISTLSGSEQVSGSDIPGGIGTNVILSVGPKGKVSGKIREFSTPLFLTSGPVPITLLLENNGDHYVLPQGKVIIRDMLGREAGEVNILPRYVLSKSSRYMVDSDQTSLSSDHAVLIWPKRFLFGVYTAHANIKLSEDGPVIESKTGFIALPLYLMFAVSFFAFVIIGIYLRVKRKI
jgi:hypothetical protein